MAFGGPSRAHAVVAPCWAAAVAPRLELVRNLALGIFIDCLHASGPPDYEEKVNHLSVRLQWGQGDLLWPNQGSLRAFLEKFSDVVSFHGHIVKLIKPKPLGVPCPF